MANRSPTQSRDPGQGARQATQTPSGMPGPGGRGRGSTIERAKDLRGTLRCLLSRMKPYRLSLAAVFSLVLVSAALALLTPYLMGVAIDDYIATGDNAGLLRTVIGMVLAYLGSWVAGVGQSILMAQISQQTLWTLRRDLFEHVQTLSLSFFDRHPHGDLMSRLTNDLDAISRVIAQNVTELFSGAVTIVGIVVLMFALNFWLALASMVVLPLMIWLVSYVGKRTRREYREYQVRIGGLNAQLEETYSGQRVIVAFG